MCGFVGAIHFSGESVNHEQLKKSARLIDHRGPDDFGLWNEEKNVGLAHLRLSIIDTSHMGHQPMVSSNKRFVIVLNGEIYNFKSLKNSLSKEGVCWKGESDTEVLLEGWARYGKAFLDKIDGMYAFAIWDKQDKKLFVARDRMGEKPLYYHYNGKSIIFSSRPNPIFSYDPSISKEYDEQGLRYFLESGYIPAPYGAYKSLKKLPPSHYMEVSTNGIEISRYWSFHDIEVNDSWKNRSEQDLLDELDDIISRSVRERMVSDVPLGAFLSGGIDSSLVVSMMQRHSIDPVKTFTIGFHEKSYDESSVAQEIATHLRTEHYCEFLSVDRLLDLFPTFLKNYDEPFFDTSAFSSMAVSRLARKHVTVSLSGDGGDELFGGYHYYKIAKVLDPFFNLPSFARLALARSLGVIPKHKAKLLSAALKKKSSSRAFAFSRSIAKDFGHLIPNNVIEQTHSLEELFESFSEGFPKKLHTSQKAMRLDCNFILNDDYLQKTDVASMAFSLESRSPLLAREIVEWGCKLPLKFKVNHTNKYLLRQLAYRYVPEKTLNLPKRGFGLPIDSWLRNQLKEWARERVYDHEYYKDLPVVQSTVIELYKLHQSGARDVHPLLWAVLMLLEFNKMSKSESH